MRRKKRFTIRLVAIGFAVAAISAPVAQAIPEGMDGSDLRALHSVGVQPVGDHQLHLRAAQRIERRDRARILLAQALA